MHSSIISAAELKIQLGKNTVVLDCRFNLMDKSQGLLKYREGHLPGAYYFHLDQDLSSPVEQHGGRHPLPNFELLEKKLRNAGINSDNCVVLYDDSRMAYAARAWWLLTYMGHTQVRILDGGFNAWIASSGAIDRREPKQKMGNFRAQLQTNYTVHRNDIQTNAALCLIDSREKNRYLGIEEPIDPIAGHIPNAVNYFWQEVTNEQGFLKPIEWQIEHWSSIPSQKDIAVYCGSGVTACVNIFSLHLCGIKTKLYPGSWSDWCSYLVDTATIE